MEAPRQGRKQKMTGNKLTDKRIAEILARAEICDDSVLTDYADIAAAMREIQERRKAETDSKPVPGYDVGDATDKVETVMICDMCGHDAFEQENGYYECDMGHSFMIRS